MSEDELHRLAGDDGGDCGADRSHLEANILRQERPRRGGHGRPVVLDRHAPPVVRIRGGPVIGCGCGKHQVQRRDRLRGAGRAAPDGPARPGRAPRTRLHARSCRAVARQRHGRQRDACATRRTGEAARVGKRDVHGFRRYLAGEVGIGTPGLQEQQVVAECLREPLDVLPVFPVQRPQAKAALLGMEVGDEPAVMPAAEPRRGAIEQVVLRNPERPALRKGSLQAPQGRIELVPGLGDQAPLPEEVGAECQGCHERLHAPGVLRESAQFAGRGERLQQAVGEQRIGARQCDQVRRRLRVIEQVHEESPERRGVPRNRPQVDDVGCRPTPGGLAQDEQAQHAVGPLQGQVLEGHVRRVLDPAEQREVGRVRWTGDADAEGRMLLERHRQCPDLRRIGFRVPPASAEQGARREAEHHSRGPEAVAACAPEAHHVGWRIRSRMAATMAPTGLRVV